DRKRIQTRRVSAGTNCLSFFAGGRRAAAHCQRVVRQSYGSVADCSGRLRPLLGTNAYSKRMIIICKRAFANRYATHVPARLLVCGIVKTGLRSGANGDAIVGETGGAGAGGNGVRAAGAGI